MADDLTLFVLLLIDGDLIVGDVTDDDVVDGDVSGGDMVNGDMTGVGTVVHTLLLLVLVELEPDELLVLELILRSLLKAPILETGGLEEFVVGNFDCCDSGAA